MKVYYSPFSPFVRKVLVSAAELGFEVERLDSAAHPIARDPKIISTNPLGQVPTFFADDGTELYDSRVVCEYLDVQAGGNKLIPAAGPARWQRLVEQSVADGLLDAALLMRYEQVIRPDGLRFEPWQRGQHEKVVSVLDRLEAWAPTFGDRVDIGTISIACGLAYLDLRFPEEPWRTRPGLAEFYARFSERESMISTSHPVPA
ncbi:glutathione S-transferase family protein [Pararobbsia silviterrae]|uniref:Glutathione S-transferase family protein n=1 Tax=Pararobbsia silviterrae TaxID=1792498 RepID=A0A494XAB6_9BURK|nr:glutathione S-transferase family protein [Pararobbsia silviterrae]RKP47695.1 glutathione S-transferase family protein [Pararobbsia silviterrae]